MRTAIRLLLLDIPVRSASALAQLLPAGSGIAVSGEAGARGDVVRAVERLAPDVIAIGIDEPSRPPSETVQRIMIERPTPIVLVTDGRAARDVEATMLALRDGALTVMSLPPAVEGEAAAFARRRFIASLRAMSEVKLVRRWRARPGAPVVAVPAPAAGPVTRRAIAIAASTGGPAALQRILSDLVPDRLPPILIVQHIAEGYIDGLVQWLDEESRLDVRLARQGDMLQADTVYVAPDGHHLGLSPSGRVMLTDDPPVDNFRPSADVLFDTAAQALGAGLTAVMLTGMGCDGVRGLRKVRACGGRIIAQDQASAAVDGMPKAARDEGLANEILPLLSIAAGLSALAAEPA